MKNIPELMIPGSYTSDSTGSIVRDIWAVDSIDDIGYRVVNVNTQGMFLQYRFQVRENVLSRDTVVRTASTSQMDSRFRDVQRPGSSIAGDDSWMKPGTLLKVIKEFPAMATTGNNFLTVAVGSAILVLSRRNSTTPEFLDGKFTETSCSIIEFTSSEGLNYMIRVLDRLASDCYHHYFTILSEP